VGVEVTSASATTLMELAPTVTTAGATGEWSSAIQTRWKVTKPMTSSPVPTFSIDFLNGEAVVTPQLVNSEKLRVTALDGHATIGITGPFGGITGLDTVSGAGLQLVGVHYIYELIFISYIFF